MGNKYNQDGSLKDSNKLKNKEFIKKELELKDLAIWKIPKIKDNHIIKKCKICDSILSEKGICGYCEGNNFAKKSLEKNIKILKKDNHDKEKNNKK